MSKVNLFVLVLGLVLLTASSPLFARPTFTGYSGAPGSRGTCASSCHGSSGGTITVTGFPASYLPGQVYNIRVARSSGSQIANFNGSCRVGTGSNNSGTIVAGYNTSIYSASGETNGVYLTNAQQDSGKFSWTAPSTGTGTVRLYVAGMQGTTSSGLNSTIVLVSTESNGVEEEGSLFSRSEAFGLRVTGANPARSGVALAVRVEGTGPAALRVYDLSGRLVRSFAVHGSGILRWDGRDAQGRLYPEGVYLFRLDQGSRSAFGKVLIIR